MSTSPGQTPETAEKKSRGGFGKKALLAVAAPLALLALLEGGLRLAGYRSAAADPYESFVLHRPLFERRGDRYATSPARAAFFHAQSFPIRKSPADRRLFVFGGSVTYGYKLPDPAAGNYGALLQKRLAEAHPGLNIQVINGGGICYASYRLVGLVEECLAYEPDVLVVMTGHNEFLEPRHYRDLMKSGTWRRLWQGLRIVQGGQEIRSRLSRGRTGEVPRKTVLAADAIDERYIVRDEEEFRQTREHYGRNLERMADLCREKGVPLILCTAPSDLRDSPPFHTAAGAGLSESFLQARLREADARMQSGQWEAALAVAEDVTRADPRSAAFHYVAGRCLDRLGRIPEAKARYMLARDTDAFPHRALTSFNERVREVARQRNTALFDAEKLFVARSPDGIPGRQLFLDNCHPRPEGHALLAEGLSGLVEEGRLLRGAAAVR